ncbi:MAG: rhomboid family intramembrane serine protease [Myxococcales bacterium]|nr:rhomboid family intramembrane serine protease [Myxococcales bacterium]
MFSGFLRNLQEVPVTLGFFILHLLLFFMMASQGAVGDDMPMLIGFPYEVLRDFGAQINPLIWKGEYSRLLFAGLLHGGLLHLVLNNLVLYNLGTILERLLGSTRFFLLYVLALFTGNVASLIFVPPYAVSVGASGAIMGLAGTLSVFLVMDREGRFLRTTARSRNFFLFLVALNLLIGELVSIINNAAHLGGFACGVAFGLFFWGRIPGTKFSRSFGSFLMACVVGFLFWGLRFGLAPQETHAWFLYQGLEAAKKGDARSTERAFMQALEKKRDVATLEKLGTLYQYTEQWEKSRIVFQELHKRDPQNPIFSIHLVEAMTKTGRDSAADALFVPLRASLEKRDGAELAVAMLLLARHKEREALLLLNQLLESEPKQVVYHNALAWTLLTAHQTKYRNPKLALRHAQIAVRETSSRIGTFLDTLATAYFQNHQPEKAVSLIQQAMRCQDAKNPINLLMIHLMRQRKRFLMEVLRKRMPSRSRARSYPAIFPARKKTAPAKAARPAKIPLHRAVSRPSSVPAQKATHP